VFPIGQNIFWKKMASNRKVLFITSFYSGLRKSIETGQWNPSGMPALYKLLEELDRDDIPFDCYFIDSKKDLYTLYVNPRFPNTKFHIVGIKKHGGKNILGKILSRYNYKQQLKKQILKLGISDYGLIYLDRGQIALRHLLRKQIKEKIMLRLHGVSELFQSFEFSKKYYFSNYTKVLGYKSHFDFILSSQDGTPVSLFLDKYCSEEVPKEKWLNGVDLYSKLIVRKENSRTKFLIVGRLEPDKGILEVIKAFLSLPDKFNHKWELTILGNGTLYEDLVKKTEKQDNISLPGSVEHSKMQGIYLDHDVLISLNFLGNISNVILESINYELAIITLGKEVETFHDIESNAFLKDHVLYVDRRNITQSLKEQITDLLKNNSFVKNYQLETQKNLKPKLTSWEKRISKEVTIIKELIDN